MEPLFTLPGLSDMVEDIPENSGGYCGGSELSLELTQPDG